MKDKSQGSQLLVTCEFCTFRPSFLGHSSGLAFLEIQSSGVSGTEEAASGLQTHISEWNLSSSLPQLASIAESPEIQPSRAFFLSRLVSVSGYLGSWSLRSCQDAAIGVSSVGLFNRTAIGLGSFLIGDKTVKAPQRACT